jgi:hypothetical protein
MVREGIMVARKYRKKKNRKEPDPSCLASKGKLPVTYFLQLGPISYFSPPFNKTIIL